MNNIRPIYLKDYKEPTFNIKNVALIFDIYEEYTIVTNSMSIIKLDSNIDDIELDSIDLELQELWLNNLKLQESRYRYNNEKLIISNIPSVFSLKIVNKVYPDNNTELEGLYRSGGIFCTQNEPEGFRRITPYLDRPDIMSIFTTTVIAEKKRYPLLLSNGNRANNQEKEDGRHSVTWIDPHPKPSYLFALVAGDLGVVTSEFITSSGEKIELNIYCDVGNEEKCIHAMDSLKKSMVWDEQKYGREYDLEIYNIVAVDSFNMGAMENKGLNIFNSHYVLADKDTATDTNFMGIESVIAHEYFHNWTGNRITCRDWFQLTLKEGLTVFRDQSFSADMNSSEVQRIEDVKALRERQFVEDASPTAHPIQPDSYISMNNFYTSTVYEKGAEVIRMIYTLLGEENYRKATDLYFEKFDGQAVTVNDFLWAMSEASGIDLDLFKLWYHQSGTPTLKVKESFQDGIYKVSFTQIIPDAVDKSKQKPYYFPLKLAILDINGSELHSETVIISQEEEEFIVKDLSHKPILSLNRDFSAPIIIEQENTNYPFLMKYDNNSFVRYESAQSFAVQTLETIIDKGDIDLEYIDAFGTLLELEIDLSYKALLLELPTISTLMQRQKVVDFEPLYKAKEILEDELALKYKDKLLDIYTQYHKPDNSDIDAISIGERALKNRVLKILAHLKDENIIALVYAQYKKSKTMTDRVIALEILENISLEFGKEILNDFYIKYNKDILVMNKYFATIASSTREGTLQRVIDLQDDEVYDEKVPNLVRSLIGSFAKNYKYFHAKDGSGYRFVVDKILEIDIINAQMASGLAGAFKIYAKLNSVNKELMKRELQRVIKKEDLSKNVYEIVGKILKV